MNTNSQELAELFQDQTLLDAIHTKLGEVLAKFPLIGAKAARIKAERDKSYKEIDEMLKVIDETDDIEIL